MGLSHWVLWHNRTWLVTRRYFQRRTNAQDLEYTNILVPHNQTNSRKPAVSKTKPRQVHYIVFAVFTARRVYLLYVYIGRTPGKRDPFVPLPLPVGLANTLVNIPSKQSTQTTVEWSGFCVNAKGFQCARSYLRMEDVQARQNVDLFAVRVLA